MSHKKFSHNFYQKKKKFESTEYMNNLMEF